jgi:hypothetical protein
MQDVLKTMKSRRTSSKTFWSNPFSIGQGLLIFPIFLLYLNLWNFVFRFAFSGTFFRFLFLYTSCVLRLRPSAPFNEIL